jgi:copper chaperone CopZ
MSKPHVLRSRVKTSIYLVLALLVFSTLVNAQTTPSITIRVDGLSCAFCAYSLEKNLLELTGVDSVEVNLNKGTATLILKNGKHVSDEVITTTVEDVGFTPRSISRHGRQKDPHDEAVPD